MFSNNIYSSPLCSCMVCHEVKSSKGIHSHFLAMHSSIEDRNRMCGRDIRPQPQQTKLIEQFNVRKEQYKLLPKICEECKCELSYEDRKLKFCSHICAATNAMKIRKDTGWSQTKESKNKTANTLRKMYPLATQIRNILKKIKPDGEFTKVYICVCKFSGKVWYDVSPKHIHPDIRETKQQYTYSCQFNFGISSYPDWFPEASELITKYGWYSTPGSRKGNLNVNGVSRDHLYSITDGWLNNVSPSIIRHPANCQIIQHKDNQRKNKRSSITLEELYTRIVEFDKMATSEGIEPP